MAPASAFVLAPHCEGGVVHPLKYGVFYRKHFAESSFMPQPLPQVSLFGLSYGWSYALSAFTLTICGCLPLALIATMGATGTGAERANALIAWLPVMAGLIALVCAALYFGVLRTRTAWRRHALMLMWALAALGMVGWWKL